MNIAIYRVKAQRIFLIVAIALAIVLVHTQTAGAFKETATSSEDAGRDLEGLNGHGFDDSCPKGHTATFCEGYKDGYNERWNDTQKMIHKVLIRKE